MDPVTVVEIKARAVCHPWEGQAYVTLPRPSKRFYSRQLHLDPFPAYAHDLELVKKEARRVSQLFPIGVPVIISVLPCEGNDRVNGHCTIEHDYKDQDKKPYPWAASIVLWGKRIPPHPAMTRYLVAHEYGHAVAKFVARRRGEESTDKLYRMYRQLRSGGPGVPKYYGGGTWHRSTGELFANDFRILVTRTEVDFWPHPGFARPDRLAAVRAFWKEQAA